MAEVRVHSSMTVEGVGWWRWNRCREVGSSGPAWRKMITGLGRDHPWAETSVGDVSLV